MAHENTVAMLMADALAKAANPLAQRVRDVAKALKKDDPLPKGVKRKLSDLQAFKSIEACTRMVRVNGLKPFAVCKEAGLVAEANGTFRYMLTSKEMLPSGDLVAGVGPTKAEISKNLVAYMLIAQAIARMTGRDETPLLEELGEAVADYLLPFNTAPLTAYEELATDLVAVGAYFSRPREAADGGLVDLQEYFEASRRMGVAFDPASGAMVATSEEPWDWIGHEPSIRLLMRRVALGDGDCYRHERNPEGRPVYTSHHIGRIRFRVDEVVSLRLVRDGGRIKSVLVAEPWTTVFGKPGEPPSHFIQWRSYRWTQGAPFGGGLRVGDGEEAYSLVVGSGVEYPCDRYKAFIEGLEGNVDGFGDCLASEAVCLPRTIEVDAGVIEDYVADIYADGLRQTALAVGANPPWSEGYAVPPTLTFRDGREANGLLDRLEEALYGDDQTLLKALTQEVAVRVRAMDELVARASSTRLAQKSRFRRKMRS